MRYLLSLLFVLMLCGVSQAQAQTSTIEMAQFSHVASITDGTDTLRQFELPADVLLQLRRSDRRDLVVFNANGQPVPSKVFTASVRSSTENQHRVLPLFPVLTQQQQGNTKYSFQFSEDGESTSFNLRAPGINGADEIVDHIIHIDREQTKSLGNLVGLKFDWEKTDENVLASVLIEGSSDLTSWQTLADDAVLSNLKHDGALLVLDEIDLPAFSGEYLRVSWPARNHRLELKSVTGKFARRTSTAVSRRQARIDCQAETSPDECWFDIGRIPVDSFQLKFTQPLPAVNYFLQGDLYSRNSVKQSWVKRGTIQQYALTVDRQRVTRQTNSLPRDSDSLWMIAFDPNTVEPFPVAADVSWRPLYAAFVAQGSGPFKVAFGTTESIRSSSRTLDSILKRSRKSPADLETVALGPVAENLVIERFFTRERIETYLLWAVLILGVGIMFRIAFGLFRRMNQPE